MALQWDLASALDGVVELLDSEPIDEKSVTQRLEKVLQLENTVKLTQLTMLVRIRNTLGSDQVAYLRSLADVESL